MNKTKLATILAGTLLMITAGLFSAITGAWYAEISQIPHDEIAGECITNYYASGSGTVDDPYILNLPKHVYNMTWLQNERYLYNQPAGSTIYFKLGADIDMSTIDGAIPPIGTEANPFTGYFDGNGKTISNLWVSSNPSDWKESPDLYRTSDFSGGVGFFGYIEKIQQTKTYAGNFFLKDVEVTSNISCDAVGIVAGYANADIRNIGVKNAIISFETGATQVSSLYSLIGITPNEEIWNDLPQDADSGGGDLIIAPNGYIKNDTVTYDPFTSQSSGSKPVDESAEGTAYYYGSLSKTTPSPNPVPGATAKFFFYNTEVSFEGRSYTNGRSDIKVTSKSQAKDLMASTANQKGVDAQYINYISSTTFRVETGNYTAISPGANATFSGKTPNNCVWFRPQAGGHCYISFIRQNNSGDNVMSVYRYKRVTPSDPNSNINSSTLQEIRCIDSKGSLGNGSICMFDFLISDEEVSANYEYAIANSSTTTGLSKPASAALFFLKLAGADTHGSGSLPTPGETNILNHIEFVPLDFVLADFLEETYMVSATVLSFTGTGSTGIVLRFNEEYNSTLDKDITYYYSSNANVVIQEKLQVHDSENADGHYGSFLPHPKTS